MYREGWGSAVPLFPEQYKTKTPEVIQETKEKIVKYLRKNQKQLKK